MMVLSLDLGTTKICALVMNEDDGVVIETRSADNVFLPPLNPWDRQQDPERIFNIAEKLVLELMDKYGTFRCIGLSNQMHGILYVNAAGRAVSPLYTWQDQCASRPFAASQDGESYAAFLAKFSPMPVAPGYGLATNFYHIRNNMIPPGAVKLCAIGDYIAMRLCNSALPLMHSSNAAGFSFFDLPNSGYDKAAMEKAGLDPSFLPEVTAANKVFGETRGGIPVSVSIGDNQASFLGAVRDPEGSVSVNIGTGSQISFVSPDPGVPPTMEARPYFDGLFLLAGSSLCGGRAYAILESFFRKVLEMAGIKDSSSVYPFMNDSAMSAIDAMTEAAREESLTVNTVFAGTRLDPSIRGSILNISEDNFTPAQFVTGFLYGIADELFNLYLPVREKGRVFHRALVGSGNGIRRNEALQKIFSERFNMPLTLSPFEEEAAYGAALFALTCIGSFGNVLEAQRFGVKTGLS